MFFSALIIVITGHFKRFTLAGQLSRYHQGRVGINLNVDFPPGCLRHTLCIVLDPVCQVPAILKETPYVVFVVHEFAIVVVQNPQKITLYPIELFRGLTHAANEPQLVKICFSQ